MGCNFSKQAVKIVSRKASECTTNNTASTPEPEDKLTKADDVTAAKLSRSATSIPKVINPYDVSTNGHIAGLTSNGNGTGSYSLIADTATKTYSDGQIPHDCPAPDVKLPNQVTDEREQRHRVSMPILPTPTLDQQDYSRSKTASDLRTLDNERQKRIGATVSKSKYSPFGPRRSRLVLTQSQVDFFRMIDEKVAQGKDYSSDDNLSIASFKSWSRKDSSNSVGMAMQFPQRVR